ncbi:hypothetical protein MYMAC_000788 [Corallococcus macrosporus DSM 14697]|uniref:Uncharacterized protein n=2 Tax=Corallococcus macrosporus TaxID=35 RepID=A0A250JMW4_9BACT|nr:hypothetical protein MYMAC_000788 [Corallococcus macrosporus DSM 14697]
MTGTCHRRASHTVACAMTPATLLLLATLAAQSPEAPPPSEATTPETVTAPPLVSTPEACAPGSEADYSAGFDALVSGDDAKALALFERVLVACPQHPYATEMARLSRTRLTPGGRLANAAASEVGREPHSSAARASLVVVQTLHGAAQGILLCAIGDCSGQGFAAVSLLGAGAGAASSLLLTRGGVTDGQAAVINSGTVWGFWFGVASLLAFDLDGDNALGAAVLGGAGFTGVGVLLAHLVNPTSGQVSLANSGGLWAGAVTALFLAAADGGDTQDFFAVELGATAAGILSMAILSKYVPVSRGRMLIIDAGGILGGLVGASAVYLTAGNDAGDAILVGSGFGVLGGLALTTYLTRNFDAPDAPQVALAPLTTPQGGKGVSMVGRF